MTTSWLIKSGIRSFRCFSENSKPTSRVTATWPVPREECPVPPHSMILRRRMHFGTASSTVPRTATRSECLPALVPFLSKVFVYFLFHHRNVTEAFFHSFHERVLVKECAQNVLRGDKFMAVTEGQPLGKRQRFVYIYRFSM